MRLKTNSPSQKGFTLIELLIVMTLISILTALLFPVFGIAREKTRQSVCASNLHQIGIANSLYLSDYDGHFAYAISEWTRYHDDGWREQPFYEDIPFLPSWPNALFPYTKSRRVFLCPSDFGARDDIIPKLKPTVFSALGASYDIAEEMGLFSRSESIVTYPSRYVYIHDMGYKWHNLSGDEAWQDTGNCLFYDGHVKLLTGGREFRLFGQTLDP